MHYLLASRSVHTTAAAADYLEDRLAADDAVTVLTVREADDDDDRDGGDAYNVAVARLSGLATVERERREGDPGEAIRTVAAERDADVVVMGARRGEPGAGREIGETSRHVLANAERPVVVVPLPDA